MSRFELIVVNIYFRICFKICSLTLNSIFSKCCKSQWSVLYVELDKNNKNLKITQTGLHGNCHAPGQKKGYWFCGLPDMDALYSAHCSK